MKTLLLLLLLSVPCIAQTPKEATVRVYCFSDDTDWPCFFGSGVLISDSQILTNYHVVCRRRKGNNSLQIRFPDGHREWATVAVEDGATDVALLNTKPHPLFKPMTFGDDLEYLDQAKSYGYTYDYEYTVRFGAMWHRASPVGVIQGNGRVVHPNQKGVYFVLVSKETSVPGDSGGPVTKDGKVVGLVESIGEMVEDGKTFPVTVCVRVDTILKIIKGHLK